MKEFRCYMKDLTQKEKEILIQKIKDNGMLLPEDSFEIYEDKIVWKDSCPGCGGDMDFGFGDFLDDYLDGTMPTEFLAWCLNKECCGHIDENGMVC